jgi:YebC/PmpR family DNA-binding regulatory protein
MAGHSRWHNIKNKKAKADAIKGRMFTKVIREITIAARLGGGDPEANPRLRMAIEKAKEVNMPMENVERAIKRGTGELEGVNYEEVQYEGYGPGGVAIVVEATTDNRNRTTAEIRHIFSKYGGNLGSSGCVSFLFEDKGIINVPKDKYSEDEIFEKAIEAGAEDVIMDDPEYYEIRTAPSELYKVRESLEKMGVEIAKSELTKIPTTIVQITDEETATKLMKLLDALEDNDDVQKVYANFDIPESLLEKLEG